MEVIEKIKDAWLESAVEIRDLFDEEVVKKEKSCLNGKTYSSKTILSFVDEVTSWAKNRADITLNETLVKKFTQSALDSAVNAPFKKKGVRITHPAFEEIEALIEEIQPSDLFKKSFSITIVKVFKRNFLNTKRIILKNPLMIYYAY